MQWVAEAMSDAPVCQYLSFPSNIPGLEGTVVVMAILLNRQVTISKQVTTESSDHLLLELGKEEVFLVTATFNRSGKSYFLIKRKHGEIICDLMIGGDGKGSTCGVPCDAAIGELLNQMLGRWCLDKGFDDAFTDTLTSDLIVIPKENDLFSTLGRKSKFTRINYSITINQEFETELIQLQTSCGPDKALSETAPRH